MSVDWLITERCFRSVGTPGSLYATVPAPSMRLNANQAKCSTLIVAPRNQTSVTGPGATAAGPRWNAMVTSKPYELFVSAALYVPLIVGGNSDVETLKFVHGAKWLASASSGVTATAAVSAKAATASAMASRRLLDFRSTA